MLREETPLACIWRPIASPPENLRKCLHSTRERFFEVRLASGPALDKDNQSPAAHPLNKRFGSASLGTAGSIRSDPSDGSDDSYPPIHAEVDSAEFANSLLLDPAIVRAPENRVVHLVAAPSRPLALPDPPLQYCRA